jgi:ATP-dependent DNA ligase
VLRYRQRRELLAELAERLPGEVARVPRAFACDEGLEAATLAMGLEGVVAKRLDLCYRPGQRHCSWTKCKHRRCERVAIVGWRRGSHGDELLVADLTGRRRGWCAVGLSGETRRQIAEEACRLGREHRGAWIARRRCCWSTSLTTAVSAVACATSLANRRGLLARTWPLGSAGIGLGASLSPRASHPILAE